jgi:hypothetical protein
MQQRATSHVLICFNLINHVILCVQFAHIGLQLKSWVYHSGAFVICKLMDIQFVEPIKRITH